MHPINNSLRREIANELRGGTFDAVDGGLALPKSGIIARGVFSEFVNGECVGEHSNLVVDQGFVAILNTYFGPTAKASGFYVALFAGAVSPAANWTATSFPATASEITSGTEGYTQTTRPAFTPADATTPVMDNYASKAAFTIATASVLNVNGAAILTSNVKGGTGGVLVAASRYSVTRQLQSGDAYEVGYRFTFSS